MTTPAPSPLPYEHPRPIMVDHFSWTASGMKVNPAGGYVLSYVAKELIESDHRCAQLQAEKAAMVEAMEQADAWFKERFFPASTEGGEVAKKIAEALSLARRMP